MKPLAQALEGVLELETGKTLNDAGKKLAGVMFYRGALAVMQILGDVSASGDPQATSAKGIELLAELNEHFRETPEANHEPGRA